uniref:Cationic amino acid transporter C-terminal domain-containing protein n=1 Tax=Globisporangium ultimum (strain ATCC 200006 / CBS 805.95 / DAOM BR144) TaxID=431595 RepID=K3WG01_GLOUD
METFGPAMAVCFSILAFAIMCFLKYIEVSAASAQANGANGSDNDDGLSLQTDTEKLKKSPQSREKRIAAVELSSISTKHIADQHPGASLRVRALSNSSSDDDENSGNPDGKRNGIAKHQHLMQLSAVELSSDTSALDRDAASTACEHENEDDKPTFAAPLVPFAPCVAIFFNWFLFAQMEATSVVLIVLWLLLALAVYVAYSARHSLAHQQLAYHRVDAQ